MSTLPTAPRVEGPYSHLVDYFKPGDMQSGPDDLRHPDDQAPERLLPKAEAGRTVSLEEVASAIHRSSDPSFRELDRAALEGYEY